MNDRDILVNRLKEANIHTQRFLKLQARTKKAFELEWQKQLYSPEQFGDYQYWGICAKDNLFFVDTDRTEMQDTIREKLPQTLEVQSPRRELSQFIFKTTGDPIPNKDLMLPGEEDASGEIRAQNEYIVAAGTEIDFEDLLTGEPRTGTYKIIRDGPIATMTSAAFMQIITPYLGKDTTQKITYEHMRQGVLAGRRHAMGIKYANFLIGVQQFDAPTTLRAMEEWNKLCKPPMPQEDIERQVRDAAKYQASRPEPQQKTTSTATLEESPWPEIPAPQPYGNSTQLTADIIEFLKPHIDFRKEEYYLIMAEWLKASWIPELFETVPYLWFYGLSDTGKTRGADLCYELTYKPIYGPSFNETTIFRAIELWHPTIIIDESKAINAKTPNADALLAVLDSGYKRRQKAYRNVYDEALGDWIPHGFDVFGFKVISGIKFISEELARRCIKLSMTRNKRKVNRTINVDDAQKLRGKLMQWRNDNLGSNIRDISNVLEGIYSNNLSSTTTPLEITDGTLLEVYSPLVFASGIYTPKNVAYVADVATFATQNTVKLYAYMFEQQWEKHALEVTSFDADLIRALVGVKSFLEKGKFWTQRLVDFFNEGKPQEEELTSRSAGFRLHKYGFVNAEMPDHKRGWYWNERLVKRLCERFDVPYEIAEDEGKAKEDFEQISDKTFLGSVAFNLRKSPALGKVVVAPVAVPVNSPPVVVSENTHAKAGTDFLICCPTCKAEGKEMTFATDYDFQAHYQTFHANRGGEQ